MPQFAIMRCKKLTGMGSVAAALQHCYRERETENADQAKTPDNEHLVSDSTDQAMGALRELLPEKRRKDAVLAVEYVMTASPEWWERATPAQQSAFVDRSMGWLIDKYGKQNIVAANVHRDEATPHISAFVVPITDDGRLSAKEFIGNKAKMTKDQTTFAESVKDLGLERGIEGSKATHQRVKSFYAEIGKEAVTPIQISAADLQPQVLEKRLMTSTRESDEMVAARLADKVGKHYEGTVAMASVARQEKRRADETAKTLGSKEKALKALQEALDAAKREVIELKRIFKGLTKDQMVELKALLTKFLEQNRERDRNLQQEKSQGKARGR
jgi:hypothetical protein